MTRLNQEKERTTQTTITLRVELWQLMQTGKSLNPRNRLSNMMGLLRE